jgi:hypothetical protein
MVGQFKLNTLNPNAKAIDASVCEDLLLLTIRRETSPQIM